jgi:hypothetical protein
VPAGRELPGERRTNSGRGAGDERRSRSGHQR